MKTWKERVVGSVTIASLFLIFVYMVTHTPPPEGSVKVRDIVSYCIGDAANDGTSLLIAITGNGEIETGESHGEFLLVCDASAEADMDNLGYIPPEKIHYSIDLSGIKPIKVQLGDINGDGVNEVAICVYKTAKFHPVMAKRPFFFNLVDGNLIPVWLGSRLSRPFDDYILYDMNADAADEIISVEQLENGNRVIAVYNWKGFGFEMLTQSEEFDGELYFDFNITGQAAESIGVIFYDHKKYVNLVFHLTDGELVNTVMDY